MRQELLDAGPLVAYLDKTDQHHSWAVRQFRALTRPLISCDAVISEACHLLEGVHGGAAAVGAMLKRGVIRLDFSLATHHVRIFALMQNYQNVPMSLAYACLLCMAEHEGDRVVFTTDSDFTIYRLHGRKPLALRIPVR